MHNRSSVLLPAPFGPTTSVGEPEAIDRLTLSTIIMVPARALTRSRTTGSSVTGARILTRPSVLTTLWRPTPRR